jgi:recombinational DNA repair protein RecR
MDRTGRLEDSGTRRAGRQEGTKEIVVATNPNTTGEATALFIAQELEETPVRVTALASGLPVGGDLEYADEVTPRAGLCWAA